MTMMNIYWIELATYRTAEINIKRSGSGCIFCLEPQINMAISYPKNVRGILIDQQYRNSSPI